MDFLVPVSLSTAQATPRLPMGAASDPTVGMAGISGLLLSAGIVVALITGTINLTLARRRSREEGRARVRTTFAEAFRVYSQYRGFPNAIICRDTERAAKERQRLLEAAPDSSLRRAGVSSRPNIRQILEGTGLIERPETILAGGRCVRTNPARATVFEDAPAGRAGRFGLVVGLDRRGRAEALRARGADSVVREPAERLEQR